MENRYNLLDEPWIPVNGGQSISLLQAWSIDSPLLLGGTSIQKLAILKFLLAIAQRAATPADTLQWKEMGTAGMAQKCKDYLENQRHLFYLYGDAPFLQYPSLVAMKTKKKGEPLPVQPIGRAYHPDIPSDNDSVVNHLQAYRTPTDADKVLFLLSIMNFSFSGKRITLTEPLTEGYASKSISAAPGPALGNYHGYLHSCLWGQSIAETVWLNLFTYKELSFYPQWENDPLIPPWEAMPKGEDDDIARALKKGFMGTLVGMSRFVLLQENGIIYTEGIQYPSHKQGWREPFMSIKEQDKVVFLDMSRKPWRNLNALLSLSLSKTKQNISCSQIDLFLLRARASVEKFGVWSGGLKVRATAGDQSVKQDDDFIESLVWLDSQILGELWFGELELAMGKLETFSTALWSAVRNYFRHVNLQPSQTIARANSATASYWSYCETLFQQIVDGCHNPEKLEPIYQKIRNKIEELYAAMCGKETARQMEAWVLYHPLSGRFFKKEA